MSFTVEQDGQKWGGAWPPTQISGSTTPPSPLYSTTYALNMNHFVTEGKCNITDKYPQILKANMIQPFTTCMKTVPPVKEILEI